MSDDKGMISDLELMQYFDGELDDAADVDAFLADNPEARDKLASLAITAALLRERVDADSRSDGIADAVMAAIEADDPTSAEHDEPASGDRDKVALPGQPAANDNARTIYIVASAAAAIAAGFFLWGRTAPDHELAEQESIASSRSGPTSIVDDSAPPPAAARADSAVDAASEDDALGVEIAAVDFGSRSGSVFYVSGARSGATAVVWVTDVGDE